MELYFRKAHKNTTIKGYRVRRGSWVLFVGRKAVAFCNGWHADGEAFIDHKVNGGWVADWYGKNGHDALNIFGKFVAKWEEDANRKYDMAYDFRY